MQREKDEWLARFVDETLKAMDEKSWQPKKESFLKKILKKSR